MHIVVNTRLLLSGRLEGIGRFADETLKRIVISHPQHQFSFLFDRYFSSQFIYADNVNAYHLFPPTRHPLLIHWFFQYSIPYFLKRHKADVFYSPDGWIPTSIKIPTVNVIHDLNFLHNPLWVKPSFRRHYKNQFPKYAKAASRLLTVSEFSRKDIAEKYNISADQISLTCNGVDPLFSPLSEMEKSKHRNLLCGGKAYFLFVGALNSRKNIGGLIEAYNHFSLKSKQPVDLVIVGKKMFTDPIAQQAYESSPFKANIHFTGRLDDKMLARTIASALALTFVSHFEGFGIPMLEAFACGTPVIASNVSSLPEIAGDAAILCSPNDIFEISSAMTKICEEADLRTKLISLGFDRVREYNWDKAATAIWNSIESAVLKRK